MQLSPPPLAQEFKGPGSGRHSSAAIGDVEASSLDLSDGSELLVEEQGVVSSVEFTSLADMEVSWEY